MTSAVERPVAGYAEIEARLAAAGLRPRGAFCPDRDDGLGPGVAWLLLLGAIGGSVWPAFEKSAEYSDGEANPLDRWSARVIGDLAQSLGGTALYPFGGPPYRPFLRWAQQAEGLTPSPLGMLIHPLHGLWHSYRGALAFAAVPAGWHTGDPSPSPCPECAAPCLSACPVGAFTAEGYDVVTCRRHLATEAGTPCMSGGCLARRACPVAPDLAYDREQTDFHMRAFLGSTP
ncbi:MAG: ferredoxin [Kiloniellales bacterium]